MTHPDIWPHVSEESSPSPQEYQPPILGPQHWVRSEDGGALFMAHPLTGVMWQMHIAVLPEFRDRTTKYLHEFFQHIRENTQASGLIGFIAEDNPSCLRAARATGFKVSGCAPKALRRSGRLLDMTIVTLEL